MGGWAIKDPIPVGRLAPTLLYVEDEETDAFLMHLACSNEGLGDSLHVVRDGVAALDYLEGKGPFAEKQREPLLPALVLLDLKLPRLNGFEVLRRIRSHPDHQQLPVIVFTCSLSDRDQAKAQALGANEFISKPVEPERFQQVIRTVCDRYLRSPRQ